MLHLRLTQPTPRRYTPYTRRRGVTAVLHERGVWRACCARCGDFPVRVRGTGENSTLEIRRTYVARNALQESYTRARRVLVHPPTLPLPFSALSMPVHLAERNCQEVRGSLDAPECRNCETKIKKNQKKKKERKREGSTRGKGEIRSGRTRSPADIHKTDRLAMRFPIERAARSSVFERGRRSST